MFRFFVSPCRSLFLSAVLLTAIMLATPVLSQNAPSGAPAATPELRVFDSSLIDKTIDPCENLYRFSCNGWFKRNPLPPDQTSYGRFTELAELNRLHLKQILEETSAPVATRSANEQKIGDEYASCMDMATVNKLGFKPLQPDQARSK